MCDGPTYPKTHPTGIENKIGSKRGFGVRGVRPDPGGGAAGVAGGPPSGAANAADGVQEALSLHSSLVYRKVVRILSSGRLMFFFVG